MNGRFQALVSGAVLALIVGWVLHVGKAVLVPIALGVLVVYVIVGLAALLRRIPVVGRPLPAGIRNAVSVLVISAGLLGVVHLLVSSVDEVMAHAPQYQQSLLTGIQRVAVLLRIETEPTWTTLRKDLLGQINVQRLLGSAVVSVSSMLGTFIVVLLYAAFLMGERRFADRKMALIAGDPGSAARLREITGDINGRVGTYLAVKTGVNVLLGAVCWVILKLFGLQFAGFLAVLIGLLNYIPYAGSFLGVLIPVVMAIAQLGEPGTGLALMAALALAQFVIGNFVDPYLMGSSLNLSPFAILVALAVWSQLWGVAGAFLAVPITAVMVIVFSEFPGTRPIAVLLSKSGDL